MKSKQSFYRFALFLLAYTLLVILWGAWVRISHSGDGCGDTWPLCQGQIIPSAEKNKTWVEFSHRLTSGMFGLFVIFLFWQGRKLFDRKESIQKALTATLIFTITEALLGAKLVLFGLVGSNDSAFRLFAMSLHQINSMMLTGSVALVVYYSSGLSEKVKILSSPVRRRLPGPLSFFVLFLGIAVTGGFAALASTLFPSSSLSEGLIQDFSSQAHYLLRLRISHPVLATLIGGSAALLFWLQAQKENNPLLRKATLQVSLSLVLGVVFGYITLFSLAPIWMKLVHLLIAHLIWIFILRWYVIRKS